MIAHIFIKTFCYAFFVSKFFGIYHLHVVCLKGKLVSQYSTKVGYFVNPKLGVEVAKILGKSGSESVWNEIA